MSDLNNKYLGSCSNKLKKCSMIIDYVYDKIINNNEIRRMIYYNTKNPLSKKGITYDNEKIEQPDVSIDKCDNISKLAFNNSMEIDLGNYIFINLVSGNFSKTNKLIIDVNVVCPVEFIDITDGMRDFEIGQRICDELDGLYVVNEFVEDIGNLELNLVDFTNARLSKTNSYMWLSLRFEIGLSPIGRSR